MDNEIIDKHTIANEIKDSKTCYKCGNPIEMYWCEECQSHSESEVCDYCGKAVAKYDPDYHLNCN